MANLTSSAKPAGVVRTIKERCQQCYACVRHCPAKAIQVLEGRAKVMDDRCIACGRCVRVCSQDAKEVESAVPEVLQMLREKEPVVACLAPSFPAAFHDVRPGQVIAGLKRLGFDGVYEVSFGAEMVARAYARLLRQNGSKTILTTPCPALVAYVERHRPQLIPHLAPIVSPMIAMGRALKQRYRPDAKVVFIGPCLAKKAEIRRPSLTGAIDSVLTYIELEGIFYRQEIDLSALEESDPSPPVPRVGRIFPVSGGLLRTAMLQGDVLESDIVVTEGADRSMDLLEELIQDIIRPRFLDVLICNGCIDGPMMSNDLHVFSRREIVAHYAREACAATSPAELERELDACAAIDLSRTFTDENQPLRTPTEDELRSILRKINKLSRADELNCGACGYESCQEKAIAVFHGRAELTMCLPYMIERLKQVNQTLKDTEEQLIQSAKLASMGQLAAGIAHEINNPLGTIMIYSNLVYRDLPAEDEKREDLKMVVEEAARCREIVAGLLDFARKSKLSLEPTDMNDLIRDSLAMATKLPVYDHIQVHTDLAADLPPIPVDPRQIKQVLLNLFTNAGEAMPDSGTFTVITRLSSDAERVEIVVSDTGKGIPEENISKLFTPFFTTKDIGKGTGLGLAVAYGIIKMHRGGIEVASKAGEGTTFTLSLPKRQSPR
ncbi:MAG: 4Fe-4S binding protein [Armatimonadetes bacterium]|nr:4Fe-4S binding protein [Armatimonadota bacterium]